MGLEIWNGSNGSWSTAGNWYPAKAPQPGDIVAITAGMVDANGVNTARDIININAIRADITTGLTIDNSSLGAGSTTNLVGQGQIAFLTLNNAVTDGTLASYYGPSEVIVPTGSYAVNRGWWAIASTTQSSLTTVANGQFINAGVIESGSHASYALLMTQNQTNWGTFQVV